MALKDQLKARRQWRARSGAAGGWGSRFHGDGWQRCSVAQSLYAALSQRCAARCNMIRCQNYVLDAGQLRNDDPMTFATALVAEGGSFQVPVCTCRYLPTGCAPSTCTSSLMLQKLKGLMQCFRALARPRPEQRLQILLILVSSASQLRGAFACFCCTCPHPQSQTTAAT